jgi:hypothetical protein
METIDTVTVFVDPTCPFAWITSRWLEEVVGVSDLRVQTELMSLSALNEGRQLDDWYRDYNDRAWRPARVAAALLASPDAELWPAFYARFGRRRHIAAVRDDSENLRLTLAELNLPPSLADAADDPGRDDELRRRTRRACAPLNGGEGGTPMLHLGPRAYFGPVLTAIPRGQDALRLWQAVRTLAGTPEFSEIKGSRDDEHLRTD